MAILELWEIWDNVHNSEDQKKRQASAQKAECTPLSIDADARKGIFSGSHGSYVTSLEDCICMDFIRRKLPCKHMYRLAMELGVIKEDAVSDISKIKIPPPIDSITLAEAVALLEGLQSEVQMVFRSFLLEHMYHKKDHVGMVKDARVAQLIYAGLLVEVGDADAQLYAYKRDELKERLVQNNITGFRKNMSLDSLVSWCIENIPGIIPAICSDAVAVTLAPRLVKSRKKIYTYMRRKFDTDLYFDPNTGETRNIPAGAEFSVSIDLGVTGASVGIAVLSFPDDEVTELLDQYGANPCRSLK